MPHYQICAFKNGSQILGTMDLQAVFEAKNYKRKKEYLRLFKTKTNANAKHQRRLSDLCYGAQTYDQTKKIVHL